MYCPNCGKKLVNNAKFCGSCGAKINATKGDQWWKILLVIIVCAAAVVVSVFVSLGIREQPSRNRAVDDTSYEDEEAYEEVRPSEEQVEALLETFRYWTDSMIRSYYASYIGDDTVNLSDYETIDAPEAYIVAAMALREDWGASTRQSVYYRDGTFYSSDEYNELSTEQKEGIRPYVLLSTSYYEKYLRNLFGEEYSLDDFPEYADQVNDMVLEDDSGKFYVRAGDYINEGVDVSIVDFSDTQDEVGLYSLMAEYTVHWAGGEPDDINYIQYRIAPDASSDYGCRIVGMVPAGDGEIDVAEVEDIGEPQAEVRNIDLDEEPYMEWQQLYADYIEREFLEIDTEAENVNQIASEEAQEYYYYYLIYLNDDDVPELLRCSSPNYLHGMTTDFLLYIQDSQVKEQEIVSVSFAERVGYISSTLTWGAMTITVWRLNEQNELVTELEAYEDYTEISINGQEVSQEEYDSKVQEGTAWMTSGEYKVFSAGNGTLDLLIPSGNSYVYDEYAGPFATGASDAITALRSGYVDPL